MPAKLRMDRAGPDGLRHVTMNLPDELFHSLVTIAEEEGRTFSHQLVWMLRKAVLLRNGGRAR